MDTLENNCGAFVDMIEALQNRMKQINFADAKSDDVARFYDVVNSMNNAVSRGMKAYQKYKKTLDGNTKEKKLKRPSKSKGEVVDRREYEESDCDSISEGSIIQKLQKPKKDKSKTNRAIPVYTTSFDHLGNKI